jgi:hypothetical protein
MATLSRIVPFAQLTLLGVLLDKPENILAGTFFFVNYNTQHF